MEQNFENINVKVAESQTELNEIYRLRYNVYIEEMLRRQEYANEKNKTIIEPIDNTAVNIGAWCNNTLIGCIRYNLGPETDLIKYWTLYEATLIDGFQPKNSGVLTKFIVHPNFRRTKAGILLCEKAYYTALVKDCKFAFMDCNPLLCNFFTKLGFKKYQANVVHWEYGEVTPMYLNLFDINHLEEIKSPFALVYNNHFPNLNQ
jgi:predicted GNAT family N-acyltransferase